MLWTLAGAGMPAAHAAGRGYGRLHHACAAPRTGHAGCLAVVLTPAASSEAGRPGVHPFSVGAGAVGHGETGGLTPADLQAAYGYGSAAGAGQTVAIVDAYDDPNIEADLAAFDAHYGIVECAGCFQKLNQHGATKPLPGRDHKGWSLEISLDVETVRAVCAQCKIDLIEASSDEFIDLAAAENTAAALEGVDEISNSYGGAEEGVSVEGIAETYEHPGVVITAATGDYGWDDWNYVLEGFPQPPAMPDAPASLPGVVAVGGTSLVLNPDGTRASESVWNDYGPDPSLTEPPGYATGGGCSTIFAAQPWQLAAPGYATAECGGGRLAADVSADADPYSGFDVYDTYNYCKSSLGCGSVSGWQTVGGTSLAAPLIAGMYALAGGSHGLASPALALYGHLGQPGALYDVTSGGSGYCDAVPSAQCSLRNREHGLALDCEGTTACDAGPGFDGPSGVGAPVGLAAFSPAAPTASITPPPALAAGVPASFLGSASSDPYPGGALVRWVWNWGDGTSGEGPDAVHAYAASGPYTITLTVTDAYGFSASQAIGVAVAPPPARGSVGVDSSKVVKPPSPDATLASTSVTVSRSGFFTLRIHCPGAVSACAGTLVLRTIAARGTRFGPLTLASVTFHAAGGASVSVRLRLGPRMRALLAGARTLRARATITAHDAAGAHNTAVALVTLRAPQRG